MSSATTHPSTVPSPPLSDSPRSVPTLDQLYEMTSVRDQRVVIQGVDWGFYEQLVDAIPEGVNILHPVEGTAFLPVRAEEVGRWVLDEDFRDGSAWARRLRAWVRAEVAPRLPR
jgi:hypothetical protein